MAKKQDSERVGLMRRVAEIYRGRPAHEVFMATAFANNMDNDQLRQLLDSVSPSGEMDFNRQLAGRPVHHWLGKSAQQIHNETQDADKTDEVIAGITEMGGHVANVQPVITDADRANERMFSRYLGPRRPIPVDPEKLPDTQDGGELEPAESPEPTFGNDRIPFSELRGKTNEQLREIPGIGSQAIERIRQLEMEAARQENERWLNEQGREQATTDVELANESTSNPELAGGGAVNAPADPSAPVGLAYAPTATGRGRAGGRKGGSRQGGAEGGEGEKPPQNAPQQQEAGSGATGPAPAGA